MSDEPLSPTAIRIAVGLVALLAIGVAVAGIVLTSSDEPATESTSATEPTAGAPRTGPVALVGVAAPDARSPECTRLAKALPRELPDGAHTLRTLPIAPPAPPAATAWGGDRGEPVVLRCGLGRPAELTPTSALREISGTRWLPVEGAGASTWYVVDRAVYVALTVPAGSGTGPLQEISATVAATLKAEPVRTRG